jgi:hypothetical protein
LDRLFYFAGVECGSGFRVPAHSASKTRYAPAPE